MGLKNYEPARHEMSISGGSLSLRGLSLEDVSSLVNHHLRDLEAIFNLFTNGGIERLDDIQFERLAMSIVQEAPGLAANLIAIASDEPEEAKQAAKLTFPVQIAALTTIGDMTFREVGGWGKGLEGIAALLGRMNLKTKLTKIPAKAT